MEKLPVTVWDHVKAYWRRAKVFAVDHPGYALAGAFAAGWLVKAIIF